MQPEVVIAMAAAYGYMSWYVLLFLLGLGDSLTTTTAGGDGGLKSTEACMKKTKT